jgi:hypothetical protein
VQNRSIFTMRANERLSSVSFPPDRYCNYMIADKGASFRSFGDTRADTTTPHGRLMLTVLGRKPTLTRHQRREVIRRVNAEKETLGEIARCSPDHGIIAVACPSRAPSSAPIRWRLRPSPCASDRLSRDGKPGTARLGRFRIECASTSP